MMIFKQKKLRCGRCEQAFGLAEIVLAMFILVTALTVVMQPALQNIRAGAEFRRSVAATCLAQEGVEIVRNIRDNRFARAQASDARLRDAFPSGLDQDAPYFCYFQYDEEKLDASNCKNDINNGYLKFSMNLSSSGFYEKDPSSSNPAFKRRVDLTTPNNNATLYNVTVYVTWGGTDIKTVTTANCTLGNHCVFTQASLTDWDYWSI